MKYTKELVFEVDVEVEANERTEALFEADL